MMLCRWAEPVFDEGSLFEIGRYQGRSIVSMLGRLKGCPVGVMINDTRFLGGGMDASAAENTIPFLFYLCDTFHLPIAASRTSLEWS